MAINSPGSFGSQISPKPHTPKSPRHFVFPQKSPSVVSSGSSGYYTPQSGCSYDRSPNAYCKPPKSPKIVNLRSPKSPIQFDFGSSEQSSPVLECPFQMPPRSPSSTTVSSSPIFKSFKKTHKVRTPPVHIHTNPGYVSPSNCSSRCNSNSTLNKKSPYSSSNNLMNESDRDSERSVRRCRKSTSDLTEETDDTPITKSTSLSRPCSPMRRGSMKGGLAYLASRRGSRDSAASNCSKEDIGPLIFQNTVRGRQRRTSNFLELPVVAHARPRVCSLPEQPLNPRISEDLYRLRTFSITNKGSVVNCGDSIISRRSRSNTSVNTTASRYRSLFFLLEFVPFTLLHRNDAHC
ncbi:uncharacterized protein LOC143909354 [Arctopsyche grandis]|uniref:uncharacterized protein LOC143909354 n=1 Tax=Arctopsyche grandis TaxID=121162 RepID=UPI00406DA22C